MGGGANPLLGRRLPKFELDGHPRFTCSTGALQAGRGVLLDLEDNSRLRGRAAAWTARVDVVTAKARPDDRAGWPSNVTAALVRPDGYIAWAAPGSHEDLPTALRRWFGDPGRQV